MFSFFTHSSHAGLGQTNRQQTPPRRNERHCSPSFIQCVLSGIRLHYFTYAPHQPYEIITIIVPILQMRKLSTQRPSKWQSLELRVGNLIRGLHLAGTLTFRPPSCGWKDACMHGQILHHALSHMSSYLGSDTEEHRSGPLEL